jgi:hypothetical protein
MLSDEPGKRDQSGDVEGWRDHDEGEEGSDELTQASMDRGGSMCDGATGISVS